MRVLVCGLVLVLAGCGSRDQTLVDQCISDYSIYDNYLETASFPDRLKAEEKARESCAPVLKNKASFKKFALEHFNSRIKNSDHYKVLNYEAVYDDERNGWYFMLTALRKQSVGSDEIIFNARMEDYPLKWDSEFIEMGRYDPDQ